MATSRKHFAYGSNMSEKRLCVRAPSAKPVGTYYILRGYALRFHKLSKKDGSGKCNAFCTDKECDFVVGRLFTMTAEDEKNLDGAEGVGYQKECVSVISKSGQSETAFTYIAKSASIDDSLRPYACYKNYVLVGAKEGGLPEDYIEKIEQISVME